MVLARFLPRDEQFFDHFTESAANALETAKLLTEIVEFRPRYRAQGPPPARPRAHRRRDHATIFRALHRTFVTPLDREDISDLARQLDDFIDWIEEIGRRIRMYQHRGSRPRRPSLSAGILSNSASRSRAPSPARTAQEGRARSSGRPGDPPPGKRGRRRPRPGARRRCTTA